MATNRKYRVFGRWYGQAYAGWYGQAHADGDMETWSTMDDAKWSLRNRDNGRLCSYTPAVEYGTTHHIGIKLDVVFFADSNEYRYIDLYHSFPIWSEEQQMWLWEVNESHLRSRLTLGPRGGVIEERA